MNAYSKDSTPAELSRRPRRLLGDERGSVAVMVAVTMTAMLAVLALGIDLGGLFNARSEAQRAADAAALAGASAFLEVSQSAVRTEATRRAIDYATSNEIRHEPVRAEDVSVWVDTDSATVTAAVRRDGISTWFARIFGVDEVNVSAQATAWAGTSGAAQCVKPFAVPDLWEETTDDQNGNRLWDEGEHWSYDPESGDRYERYSGAGSDWDETGYGSHWRDGEVDDNGRRHNRDYGRRITVKVTDPHDAYVPSFFLPWVLPEDPDQLECGENPGGGNGGGLGGGDGDVDDDLPPGQGNGLLKWREKRDELGVGGGGGPPDDPGNGGGGGRDDGGGRGAAQYRQNICSCNNSVIDLDTEYMVEPGNMVGPTFQGVQKLIEMDPGAYWDDRTNSVVSEWGMDSPRVVTVALFDPGEINKPGRQYLRFNNFARVFIEEQADRRDPVTGRFLYYVRGVGGRTGETKGSLVRVLQLIR
ncbi:MAG TPA: pilus assembly protein TadG-related protein [Longimicrobiales bacterium]|nr:pilus assembly protein TadG-related protein [Longimicrobiales bacterium]